jgi:hypothetical protein
VAVKQLSSRRRPAQVSLKGTASGRLARGVSARLARPTADWRDWTVPLLLVGALALGVATGWALGGTISVVCPLTART